MFASLHRFRFRVRVGLVKFFNLFQGFKLYLVFCAPTCQAGLPGLQIVDYLVHNLLDFRRYIAMASPTLYHKFTQRKWNCACFHVVQSEESIRPLMLCAPSIGGRKRKPYRKPSADLTLILSECNRTFHVHIAWYNSNNLQTRTTLCS